MGLLATNKKYIIENETGKEQLKTNSSPLYYFGKIKRRGRFTVMLGMIISIVVLIIIFMIIANLLYVSFAKMSGRIKDFCEDMEVSASITPVLLILFGIWFIYEFSHTWWVGAICIALPILSWVGAAGLNIWKVVLAKILGFPIFAALVLLSLISANQKSKTKNNWDGTQTTYTYSFPEEIETGNWQLKRVYFLGGINFYENFDGTRCLVRHKHTLSFDDVQYDVTPLYNINDPKPSWIRWLY